MSDPARAHDRPRFRPHPEDEAEFRVAALEAKERPERLITISPEQIEQWAKTGEWPESLG